jgi:hypothetical protein
MLTTYSYQVGQDITPPIFTDILTWSEYNIEKSNIKELTHVEVKNKYQFKTEK